MQTTKVWCACAVVLGLWAGISPVQAQKTKDTLRIALQAPIDGVDYHYDPRTDTFLYAHAIFDHLVSFNWKEKRYEPRIAKSWTRIDDKTLELELRNDAVFHDGQKLTADDVVYTINWLVDEKTKLRFKSTYEFIAKAEKLSDTKVRLTYNTPNAADLAIYSEMLPIYPKHVHEPLADKQDFGRKSPVGTGPYRALQVDSNKGVLLEKNAKYNMASPANPAVSINRVQFLTIPDPGTQVANLLTKEIDFTYNVDTEQGRQLGSNNPNLTYTYSGGMGVMYMAFDAKGRSGMKPIQDVRVRRALVLAVDRKALVELATSDPNFGPPPDSICSPIQAGCAYSVPVPGYDPAAAKKLLAEAGYPDGFEMEITSFATPDNKRVAQAIAGYFRAVGVRASVDSPIQVTYRKKQSDGKIQLMIGPWTGGGLADVNFTLDLLYNTPDARDYHGDDEVKKLAVQLATTANIAQRIVVGQKMFDLTVERAEIIPLAPSPKFFVHTKDLTIGDAGRIVNFGAMPGDFKWK